MMKSSSSRYLIIAILLTHIGCSVCWLWFDGDETQDESTEEVVTESNLPLGSSSTEVRPDATDTEATTPGLSHDVITGSDSINNINTPIQTDHVSKYVTCVVFNQRSFL